MNEQEPMVRWKCPCGGVLGVVTRNPAKSRHLVIISTLVIGKQITEMQLEVAVQKSRVVALGPARVTCEYCGRHHRWIPAAHGMEELIEGLRRGRERGVRPEQPTKPPSGPAPEPPPGPAKAK